MTFTLGITGGIATGKSTAVARFKEYGFPVIDADVVAREVVEPGTVGLAKIVSTFGAEILLPTGSLDRKKLGQIIFHETDKRQLLDHLLDEAIRTKILADIEKLKGKFPLVIVDIPLLYEADYSELFDQIAVVYLPEMIQKKRLMKRDDLTVQEAEQRLASQWSIEDKKARADILFDNQGSIEKLNAQVDAWLKKNKFIEY